MNSGKRALRNAHFRPQFQTCNSRPRANDIRDPRRSRMIELKAAGLTLKKIGAEFGVTGERARQLIGATGRNGSASKRKKSVTKRTQRTRRVRPIRPKNLWMNSDCETQSPAGMSGGRCDVGSVCRSIVS